MEIEITPHDDVIVLSVTGSVDSLNAEQLTSAFAQPIAEGRLRLVADFARSTTPAARACGRCWSR